VIQVTHSVNKKREQEKRLSNPMYRASGPIRLFEVSHLALSFFSPMIGGS